MNLETHKPLKSLVPQSHEPRELTACQIPGARMRLKGRRCGRMGRAGWSAAHDAENASRRSGTQVGQGLGQIARGVDDS
jgi:hypothetical protein